MMTRDGGGGFRSYGSEKVWSSINHSILSAAAGRIWLVYAYRICRGESIIYLYPQDRFLPAKKASRMRERDKTLVYVYCNLYYTIQYTHRYTDGCTRTQIETICIKLVFLQDQRNVCRCFFSFKYIVEKVS